MNNLVILYGCIIVFFAIMSFIMVLIELARGKKTVLGRTTKEYFNKRIKDAKKEIK